MRFKSLMVFAVFVLLFSATSSVNATPIPNTPTPTALAINIPTTTSVTAEHNIDSPGFESLFAIAGLLLVAYIVLRKKK